jgi:hypothetical protein
MRIVAFAVFFFLLSTSHIENLYPPNGWDYQNLLCAVYHGWQRAAKKTEHIHVDVPKMDAECPI